MICIPIVAGTTEAAIADMQEAGDCADVIEIRLDYIRNPDLKRIIAAAHKPLIITVMPPSENGKFAGTEEQRIQLLRQALELGTDYVDINYGCVALPELIRNKKTSKVIVSYHNFQETPPDLESIYRSLAGTGADIVKIATFANKLGDSLAMLDLAAACDSDIIALCMGELGEVSRILAPLFGSYLTFASLARGRESAPGQIPADILRNVYRLHALKPGCDVYGIVGDPVVTSRGFLIHNALFKMNRMNSVYVNFLAHEVADFMGSFAKMTAGFSITMPHKCTILPMLDYVDPLAARIGAVNTVVKTDGKLWGYNTDVAGVIKPILARTSLRGRRVTLLGAGGAARAAAYGVVDAGGVLTVLNRTVAKAEALARELDCSCGPVSDFARTKTDILINMTSVGMHPHTEQTPLDPHLVHDIIVFDGIYNPAETMLLREAAGRNCTVISGLEMFVTQAAEQFRIWTGIQSDIDELRGLLQ